METHIIGKPLDRLDGRAKVTGTARYSAEFPLENMAYACLLQSTIARGRISALDAGQAEQAPGVLAVLTHHNAPTMVQTRPFDPASKEPGSNSTTAAILQTSRIYWHGQPVAVIVADTFEQARYAASLVKVGYAAEESKTELGAARAAAFLPDSILGEPAEVQLGDARASLTASQVQVDSRYTTPRENHNPIELHATTAVWRGDQLTVYDASQNITGVKKMLAETFSVPAENVRVMSQFVGGGFGSKGLAWPHVPLAVAAARAVGRPVKLVLSRAQVFGSVGYRTPTEQRVALGADETGTLRALLHSGLSQTSTTNNFIEPFTFPARHLYASPNILVTQKIVSLDVCPPTFMRAPGETPGTFALESALDELAYALKIDPVELRLRNDTDRDPTEHKPFSQRRFREACQLGAGKFGWSRRNPLPRSTRDGRYLIGTGVATAYYPVHQSPAKARVRIDADGSATVQSATHEMGMGTATAQTQIAADLLGLPVARVTFEYGDTRLPVAPVSGGSSTSISIGAAVQAAVQEVHGKLLELARSHAGSPLREATVGQVLARDGGLFLKDDPARGETYSAILKRAGQQGIAAVTEAKPGAEEDEQSGRPDAQAGDEKDRKSKPREKFSKHSFGAQFCEVRVDEDLGEVRVTRFTGAFDCGRILNAKTARSQFIGGIVMGIGMALMEETVTDPRSGGVVNANLADYLLPTHADVPAIDIYYLDQPDPHTPLGAHGIGEIGTTGVAAAIANAVYHATGKRIRDLPITPDKLI